jgi:cytochrome c2
VARRFRIDRLSIALVFACAAISPSQVLAQVKPSSNKKASNDSLPAGGPASVARGQIVYKDRCAICHFSESDARKIGPGLKGVYQRGKFTDGGKVDDASVERRILNGGKDMPPFKGVLNPSQVRDLISYVKTLR